MAYKQERAITSSNTGSRLESYSQIFQTHLNQILKSIYSAYTPARVEPPLDPVYLLGRDTVVPLMGMMLENTSCRSLLTFPKNST